MATPSGSHRGRPNRVSSMPSTRTGSRLDQLDRAVHDHRPLHRRPRHPVRRSDLGLIPAVLHGHRQRGPQPRGGAHPGRDLGDLLGERLPRTDLGAAPPTPLAPLHRDLPATTRQVVRAGQHPVLARGRHHPARRATRRVRVVGDQLHDPHPERARARHAPPPTRPGPTDTTHHRYGQPRSVALLSLLQNTARIKESRAALVQARRTGPNLRLPAQDPFAPSEPGAPHGRNRTLVNEVRPLDT